MSEMMQETKTCQNCKNPFTIEPDDFGFYEKIGVPPPTFCPECRLERRLLFRNERSFYKRACDLCHKSIISIYPDNALFPVYCVKCWWSDNWDPKSYGRDYDLSRPFFDQFKELFYSVPMLAMMNDDGVGSVDCEYTYDFSFSKKCYLVSASWYLENTMYTYHGNHSKDVVDCYHVTKSNILYEMVASADSYKCAYGVLCYGCTDVYFGYDMRGCTECIMCVGLRNKSYCILNKQYTKEEYFAKKKEMQLNNRDMVNKYKSEFNELILQYPRKYTQSIQTVNSTGNLITHCKNAHDAFLFYDLEDCRYMVLGDGGKNSYDCNHTGHPSLCYESVTPDNSHDCIGAIFCWKCTSVRYSNNCHSSNNIFGCSGLKQGEYMILNKQYSKEEYLVLQAKIISQMKADKQWGEFFPVSMSPHTYNESPARDWLHPKTQQEATDKGFGWKEDSKREYKITVLPDDIPKTIRETNDSIVNEIIGCRHGGTCDERCTTAFKITNQELEFYRRFDIPLPEICHNCRYYERLKFRNPPKLWHRPCSCFGTQSENGVYQNTATHTHCAEKCPNEFETSYAPDRPEIVYCEGCYQAEVA